MKNCNNCGAEIDEGAIYCPYCGSRYNEKKKPDNQNTNGTGTGSGGSYDPKYGYIPDYSNYGGGMYGGGFGAPNEVAGTSLWVMILSFALPLVGLILYYKWRFTDPGKAASAANGALASVCFGTHFLGFVLWYVWRISKPKTAKLCMIASVIGIVFSIVLSGFMTLMAEVYGFRLW